MAREGVELDVSETELKLGLPGAEKKRVFCEVDENYNGGKKSNKNEVVGWPPVCSYRRKNVDAKTNVKVSMDGAPFLRKIELGTHTSYSDLGNALDKLFGSSCIIGEAMKDARGSSELIPIYEDKDGDWMLVGDVPWQMFRETCKRLRIMRKSEAEGFGVNLKGASKK